MGKKGLRTDAPGSGAILLGNEAIARGVIEAGVQVVAAYPGTPSSEIVATLAKGAKEDGRHVEWSTNEKVAFECAAGAAFLGCRAFSAMKSVGLNVAMDALMVVNTTGVEGGFVFLSADDPNCWSTQNEQDSRLLADAAEVPCIEPSSVQEAKDMTVYAYWLSEALGRAVMLRTVTRLNHARAVVTLGPVDAGKRMPAYRRQRAGFPALPKHRLLHEEKARWRKILSDCPFNRMEMKKGARTGIITAGNASNYVREALSVLGLEDEVSLLKIGVINPLPEDLIRTFLSAHENILVFEEIEPYIETRVKGWISELADHRSGSGYRLIGKLSDHLEVPGELTTEKAVRVIAGAVSPSGSPAVRPAPPEAVKNELLLNRNPVLCAGCPHMGTLYAIRKATRKQKVRALISGDIGCYGLGVFPPYSLFDSHLCMGASIGIGNGWAATGYRGPILCVLGDSTFFHSGISPLVNAVINRHRITVVILDNAIVAMTGHQPAPGSGFTASGDPTKKIDIASVVRACGVEHVSITNPFQVDTLVAAIREAISFEGPSVVIAEGECAILKGRSPEEKRTVYCIDPEKCDGCAVCVNLLYCPALTKSEEGYSISPAHCAGCGICAQVCPKHAIEKKEE